MSDYKISKILLNNGADPNAKDDNNQTPFHTVAFMDDKNFVDLMAKHDGDINSQYDYGSTPLHLAVVIKNSEMVKILLECKCDRLIKNAVELTAKDYAFDDKKYYNCSNNYFGIVLNFNIAFLMNVSFKSYFDSNIVIALSLKLWTPLLAFSFVFITPSSSKLII